MGKDLTESAQNGPQVVGGDLVELEPLAEPPFRLHSLAAHQEELPGKEIGYPGHPGIRGLGNDHVETFRSHQEKIPGILGHDLDPGIPRSGFRGPRRDGRDAGIGRWSGRRDNSPGPARP